MNRRHAAGVTLIEIMIALVVMGILIALGVPAFSAFMQNAQIRDAAESIQNGLQIARSEAVKRNVPVTFTLNGPNTTWTVAAANPPGADIMVQAREASEGSPNVEASVPGPGALPVIIVFDGLGKTNLTELATIELTNPTGGACDTGPSTGNMRCLNVTVAVGGQIKMCDPRPDIPVGDTRKCPS